MVLLEKNTILFVVIQFIAIVTTNFRMSIFIVSRILKLWVWRCRECWCRKTRRIKALIRFDSLAESSPWWPAVVIRPIITTAWLLTKAVDFLFVFIKSVVSQLRMFFNFLVSAKTASKVLSGLAKAIEFVVWDAFPGCFTSILSRCCCKSTSEVEVVLQERWAFASRAACNRSW